MSTARRKIIIKTLRAEGAQAAKDGRHRQSCPYNGGSFYYPDVQQWLHGYDEESRRLRAEMEERDDERDIEQQAGEGP